MIKITIGENQGNQRLDRFLRKYFAKASLGYIYKLIRKNVKVNGKRRTPETMLNTGDELTLYIDGEEAAAMQREARKTAAKKQFSVIYEDSCILIADKPQGLLTHGDSREKKNHLANQVLDYLISKGQYDPRSEKTFAPSPANRLDRNTTGLVLFGKTSSSLQELNRMIRERDCIDKIYTAIVLGEIDKPLKLADSMTKETSKNITLVGRVEEGKIMETDVFPLKTVKKREGVYTLTKVQIHTGRTHQIRAQLAAAGFPIIGDSKYGNRRVNEYMKERYGLTAQTLHASELKFSDCGSGPLAYLQSKEFVSPLPERFKRIKEDIFG